MSDKVLSLLSNKLSLSPSGACLSTSCSICSLVKMRKLSFPSNLQYVADFSFDLIDSDIARGPYRHKTHHVEQHILTLMDDHS